MNHNPIESLTPSAGRRSRRAIPFGDLRVFVATRASDVPPECHRYFSVDGSVPGAVTTWDHHVTGERINLDAMPSTIDASKVDGIGTTLADTDALTSVVAAMFGGPARLPAKTRAVFEAASHRCDHLTPHPTHSSEIDRLGEGLHEWVSEALAAEPPESVSAVFARRCAEVAERVADDDDLPYSTARHNAARALAERIDVEGRIARHGRVALIDLRGVPSVSPEALYARFDCPVAVVLDAHPAGGHRYVVGVNPFACDAPRDLCASLEALALAEFAHGAPAVLPRPGPGSENWGGRATVFGSPWNFGSRLTPADVVAIVGASLDARMVAESFERRAV